MSKNNWNNVVDAALFGIVLLADLNAYHIKQKLMEIMQQMWVAENSKLRQRELISSFDSLNSSRLYF